jgi:hypothetical protein
MLRGWLRNRRERKVQEARVEWARERAGDLKFARASYRAYTGKDEADG